VSGALYLAWRYLAHHRVKTAILVAAIALIAFLPAGLNVLVGESARELTARAEATPLLVGARGSPLSLALRSLYFESDLPEPSSFAAVERVDASGLAMAIPLHVRFHAGPHPIVGTSLDYFDFRGLHLAEGRLMAVLGECVLGARAATRIGVGLGGHVVSSPESVLDLAGAYPLRMRVAGVLAPSFGPDDEAVFVDVKTAWVIAGLGHGHQDLAARDAASAVLAREEGRITANASLVEHNEITAENAASFHFHGDPESFPLTAVIAVPDSEKARVLLMGRYEGPDEISQIVRPIEVVDALLGTVFTVRQYVVGALAIVAGATLAVAGLVFLLSLRLRRREVETLVKIGAARATVATVLAAEVVFVLVAGAALAVALTGLMAGFGSQAIRAFLVS
jgi:putative ABC transport system permease protein